jgi:hypothetical protein
MPDMNRVSASMSADDIAAITTAIQTIQSKLPFLVGLSDADRMALPKMGDKSSAFHDKAAGYMDSNPDFLPGYVKADEVAKDQALRGQMLEFYPQLSTLFRSIEDTLMVINSELYMADLAYYQNVREAASRGIAGAQAIYNDLSVRFPGRPSGTKPAQIPAK